MADKLPAGPYQRIQTAEGTEIPWYILPFDKNGRSQAPLTRQHLIQTVGDGDYTDILLFSHGWNNDWKSAISLYESFIKGSQEMRESRGLTYSRPFHPLLVGIFWPSTALVMPWEAGPQFAAGGDLQDQQVEQERREVDSLAEQLDQARVERFYALTQQDTLSPEEARELAEIIAPLYASEGDELAGAEPAPAPEELLETWHAAERLQDTGDTSGEFGPPAGAVDVIGGITAAGPLDFLDPRRLVRLATVWQMKDRAGKVGASGVAPLLRDLLAAGGQAALRLLGHSYGCKVVLSALCYPDTFSRMVDSVLLLQPAVSCLCFAESGASGGGPGGYRAAVKRVKQPILTTFSRHDMPLRQVFHLAVRRKSDLGEAQIAGAPPGRYAALGGYGPAGADEDTHEMDMAPPGAPYFLGAGQRPIVALNGDEFIKGHGDVSNEATWWALFCQVNSGGA